MARQQAPNTDLASDTARANLLTNGGFRVSQRGTSWASLGYQAYGPDRWQAIPNGSSTFTSLSVVLNGPSAASSSFTGTLTFNAGDSAIKQVVKFSDGNHYNLRGKRLSLSMWVYSTGAGSSRIYIYADGTGGALSFSTVIPANTWTRAVVQNVLVPSDATYLEAGLYMTATTTFYMSEAMLVPGAVAADYAPLHPQEDLARCQRYYEVVGPGGSATVIIRTYNHTAVGANHNISVRWQQQKVTTPTTTKVGTWGGSGGMNQPIIASNSYDGFRLDAAAPAATGDMYVFNTNAGNCVTGEANP